MPIVSEVFMSSVAITGAGGYVGSHLAAHFLKRGWRVISLSRGAPDILGVEHIPFSLDQPAPDLSGRGIDVLVHAAYDFSPASWNEINSINIEGTRRLLAACRAAKVPRLIVISSLSAFQGTRSLYGKAKLAIEQVALAEKGCVIRPGLVYGGQAGGMIKTLELTASSKRWSPILSHGSSKIYTVHVDDLCELVFQMAAAPSWPPPQPIYLAANRTGWTLQSIMKTLSERAGHSIFLFPIPWPLAWGGLRLSEILGLRLAVRSDSVLSLVIPNPDIGKENLYWPKMTFRGFRGT
jgi:nucleoside-diphosphate-sugar epimerase